MKKSLLLAGMLAVGLANAQTGKVGINTENPNETLEINGTLRVDNLPESGVGTIYDGAETTGTTFVGTRALVADEKGNIGYAAAIASSNASLSEEDVVKVGVDGVDALEETSTSNTAFSNVNSINDPVKSGSFTLTKRSVVFINTMLSITVGHVNMEQIQLPDGSSYNAQQFGAQTKRIGLEMSLNPEGAEKKDIMRVSVPLTQMDMAYFDYKTSQVTGTFGIPGSRTLVLEPGTYEYELRFRFQKHSTDTTEYTLKYGHGSTDALDIVAIPLE